MSLNLLNHAEVVFWDFDGVIKESTYVKNQAYAKMFSKENAINQELKSGTNVKNCLFIGDSTTDYKAAKAHYMPFLLRETEENKLFFLNYSGPRFNDFGELYES